MIATDTGHLSSTPVTVEINILDENDNAPIFYQQGILNRDKDKAQNNLNCNFYNDSGRKFAHQWHLSSPNTVNTKQAIPQFYLEENSPPQTFIAWLKAYDLDLDANAAIDYDLEMLERPAQANLFTVDSNGIVRSESAPNGYQSANYSLKIIAKDRGTISLSTAIIINVKIISKIDQFNGIVIDFAPNKKVFLLGENVASSSEQPLVKINAKIAEQAFESTR